MKHCIDCKWYDADQRMRQHRITASSNLAANAIIGYSSHIKPMEDEEIRELQKKIHEVEHAYFQWEMWVPPTCGNSMVVRPEDGKQFDSIEKARQFCGYIIPEHWEKQTEVLPPWRMEAYEKTFEIVKKRIERSTLLERERDEADEELFQFRQERSIFQRIKDLFIKQQNDEN